MRLSVKSFFFLFFFFWKLQTLVYELILCLKIRKKGARMSRIIHIAIIVIIAYSLVELLSLLHHHRYCCRIDRKPPIWSQFLATEIKCVLPSGEFQQLTHNRRDLCTWRPNQMFIYTYVKLLVFTHPNLTIWVWDDLGLFYIPIIHIFILSGWSNCEWFYSCEYTYKSVVLTHVTHFDIYAHSFDA